MRSLENKHSVKPSKTRWNRLKHKSVRRIKEMINGRRMASSDQLRGPTTPGAECPVRLGGTQLGGNAIQSIRVTHAPHNDDPMENSMTNQKNKNKNKERPFSAPSGPLISVFLYWFHERRRPFSADSVASFAFRGVFPLKKTLNKYHAARANQSKKKINGRRS